jgi:CHAD domain-containing protein
MSSPKWISSLTPSTPVEDAARRVLMARLEFIRDYLPLAVHESAKDPEYVHQLRVGTRRGGAALDMFSVCLPDKIYRGAKKRLRRLRRSAGAARDWDVFLDALASWLPKQPARQRPGVICLIGYASAQRFAAQTDLETNGAEYPFSFERFLAETLAAVERPRNSDGRRLIDLGRPLLRELVRELEEATTRDLDDYEHLHEVRIIGKRLRYAMEIFADCFPPVFRDIIYPKVEEMQEILGNANDSHVAQTRLLALRSRLEAMLPQEWPRLRPGIDGLLDHHQKRQHQSQEQFMEFWTAWRQSGGESAMVSLLNAVGNQVA